MPPPVPEFPAPAVPDGVSQLYSAAQARACDAHAIEQLGIPGALLMERAGRAAFAALRARWQPRTISIWCGKGNNAGDGWVVAALARDAGMQVQLLQVGAEDGLSADAAQARQRALARGVQPQPFTPDSPVQGEVLVDALLGTGLQGAVRAPFDAAIRHLNQHAAQRPVLALDIPSGLCADTGQVLGDAVRATHTVTFIVAKQGLAMGAGPEQCGSLELAGLDVPEAARTAVGQGIDVLRHGVDPRLPAPRARGAHKGSAGRVLLVGGAAGTAGAALLACEGALRVGAGLVSAALDPAAVPALLARCPEVMARGLAHGGDLDALLATRPVVVCGPGLGQGPLGEQALARVLDSGLPLVLDADALNLLAAAAGLQALAAHPAPVLITPHPGEAARLLGSDTAAVQADRIAAVRALAASGAHALLKGQASLVADAQGTALCPYGNPGMASGGMGDVLAGVLGGLLAQFPGQPGWVLRLGVQLHALAADRAVAVAGERGLRATDLAPHLRRLLNGVAA